MACYPFRTYSFLLHLDFTSYCHCLPNLVWPVLSGLPFRHTYVLPTFPLDTFTSCPVATNYPTHWTSAHSWSPIGLFTPIFQHYWAFSETKMEQRLIQYPLWSCYLANFTFTFLGHSLSFNIYLENSSSLQSPLPFFYWSCLSPHLACGLFRILHPPSSLCCRSSVPWPSSQFITTTFCCHCLLRLTLLDSVLHLFPSFKLFFYQRHVMVNVMVDVMDNIYYIMSNDCSNSFYNLLCFKGLMSSVCITSF
jgi:hypothetical protein